MRWLILVPNEVDSEVVDEMKLFSSWAVMDVFMCGGMLQSFACGHLSLPTVSLINSVSQALRCPSGDRGSP